MESLHIASKTTCLKSLCKKNKTAMDWAHLEGQTVCSTVLLDCPFQRCELSDFLCPVLAESEAAVDRTLSHLSQNVQYDNIQNLLRLEIAGCQTGSLQRDLA